MTGRADNIVKSARRDAARLLQNPWYSIGWLTGWRVSRQLAKEIKPGHCMWGRKWHVIARDGASDDVLFVSEAGEVANVHLGWTVHVDPKFPSVGLHESVAAFAAWLAEEAAYVTELLNADDAGAVCTSCGANWAEGESNPDCVECGGFALSRHCPVCGGQCGAIWQRAIIDSNDRHEAHWMGKCKLG